MSKELKIVCKINLLTQRKNAASNLAIYYQEQINDLEKELKEIRKTQETSILKESGFEIEGFEMNGMRVHITTKAKRNGDIDLNQYLNKPIENNNGVIVGRIVKVNELGDYFEMTAEIGFYYFQEAIVSGIKIVETKESDCEES